MSELRLIVPDAVIASAARSGAGLAVAVRDDRVVDVAPPDRFPGATRIELPGTVVMPGLVNAHHHGRAVSSFQLGARDDILELFMQRARVRRVIDPGLQAALAACRFIAGGVTGALQANTPHGTGDHEAELRATLAAYDAAGLRAAVAVGCLDRAELVYPDEATSEFLATLPPALRALVAPRGGPPLYGGGIAATVALAGRLRADYETHPRLAVGYGPAGPQWVSDAMLRAVAAHARQAGLFVHFHGLESFAQVPVVARLYPEGFMARLRALDLAHPGVSIAHAVWMSEADARIAAETGVTFVRNPSSNLRLRTGIAPLAEYLARGVTMAVGTDNFCLGEREDLFAELRLAEALARSPFWEAPPPPTPAQLLDMATVNGARAAGFGGRVGRLEPGWKADLIAVSLRAVRGPYLSDRLPLLEQVLERAHGGDVVFTMVDGRVLYPSAEFDARGARLEGEVAAAVERARPGLDPALAEEIVRAAERFYRPRSAVAALPPHWRPLGLDRLRTH